MHTRVLPLIVSGILSLGTSLAVASDTLVDNCATLLGSLAVELRVAHSLPHGTRTTFACPRDIQLLLGVSRTRILNSLGTPDQSDRSAESGNLRWVFQFGARHAESDDMPVLALEIAQDAVSSVDCRNRR